jgi:hypothetical protein
MNDAMDIDDAAPRAPKKPAPKKKPASRRPATVAKPQARPPAAPNAAGAAQPQARAEAIQRRSAPRPVPPRAEATRDVARENPRDGAVVALARDGQRLTRRRIASGDPLDVPAHEIPAGWDYQWNPVAVLNKPIGEVLQGDLQMYQNGWRPVPASRHPGRWTPVGFDGDIVVKDLRLEERPTSLGDEARAEDQAHARAQLRDRTDALRMTQKQLPGANVARQRGQGGGLKIDFSTNETADIPRPQHELDTDGGEF